MILFLVVFDDATFNTRTKNIMKLTSREPSCHYCYFVNGLTQWLSNGGHLAHTGRNFSFLRGNLFKGGTAEEKLWRKNLKFYYQFIQYIKTTAQ